MSVIRPRPIIGVYEKPFWQYVQNRELRLQRCDKGHFRYPPGPSCPHCASTSFAWEPVSGRARLCSWTVFHRQYFPELPVPYTVVSAMLKEGPMLIANLLAPCDVELSLGMPLHIVFEDCQTADGDWVLYQWSP